MIQGNLALKLEDFRDSYCDLHLMDNNFEQNLPDNIIQFLKAEVADIAGNVVKRIDYDCLFRESE